MVEDIANFFEISSTFYFLQNSGIQIIFGNICKKCRTKFVMIREFPNINKAEWRMENKTCSSGRICRKGRKNVDNGTKRSFK